jgi:predicted amidophosphoribosyltransferase
LCHDWPAALVQARSAVWLDTGARDAAHALKYRGLPRIAADLAAAIVRHVPAPRAGAVLVPVPLGALRGRRRGYNQSERLARALGLAWQLPVRGHLLARRRETATQTALTPEARLANVAGAFQLRIDDCGLRIGEPVYQSAIRNPQSAIVLVDDVLTTGATIAECARVLAGGGFAHITAVTFGRAAIPDFT